jgi:lipoate-protein ligase A
MTRSWRILDTGLRGAAANIAFNRALLEARHADEIPSTLRFLRFTPSALIGFHQSAKQALDVDYCCAHNIEIQRRITGGGAIYFDETQLGWELYLHRRDVGVSDMQEISRRICEAAARGISSLGVNAQFRPRNDIEVEGRKISGTGGAFEGDALMYQGTLLIAFDVERMFRVLRIPTAKLSDKAIASARERVANLSELLPVVPSLDAIKTSLARAFEAEFRCRCEPGELTQQEQRRFRAAVAEIDTPDWVYMLDRPRAEAPLLEAVRKFPAGLIRACVIYDRPRRRLKQVWFSGDFFVSPRRAIADLEAALRDIDQREVRVRIERFFAENAVDTLGLSAADFSAVANDAVRQAQAESISP